MSKLGVVPHGLEEIKSVYGDPDMDGNFAPDIGWEQENLVWVEAPYPLFLPWRMEESCSHIRCHHLIAGPLLDALYEIFYVGVVEDREQPTEYVGGYLHAHGWDRYGGCYHFRKMISYDALSTHSWGIAIDLNPQIASWGADPSTQPRFIVDAFKERGFEWGGDWPPEYTSDPMHFQAATGY